MSNRNLYSTAHDPRGDRGSITHVEHASASKHKQAEFRQLRTDCKGNSRGGLPAHVAQEAFPDVHGEVRMQTRTTTTSMLGIQSSAKEGLQAEVQAQRRHTLLQGHKDCSSTSMPPLPYSTTSLCHIIGTKGTGQPCPGSGDDCCLQLAESWGFTSAHTPTVQTGTAHQIINFSPKGLGIKTPKQGHTCGSVCQHHSRQEE